MSISWVRHVFICPVLWVHFIWNRIKKASIWQIIEKAALAAGLAASFIAVLQFFQSDAASGPVDLEENTGKAAIISVTNDDGTQDVHIDLTINEADAEGVEASVPTPNQTLESIRRLPPEEQLAYSCDLIRKGFYDDAKELLTSLLQQDGLDKQMKAVIYYNRGLCHAAQDSLASAETNFRYAIGCSPFAEAYNGLAYTCMALNERYEEAIDTYTTAISLTPNPDSYLGRAYAYQLTDKHDAAEADYNAVLNMDPENDQATHGLELLHT